MRKTRRRKKAPISARPPAPRHLAMPGKQKGHAAREEEKLHPVPAEDGEAMDGIGKFGIAEGEMAGDDEQDGVATQGVDIGENASFEIRVG